MVCLGSHSAELLFLLLAAVLLVCIPHVYSQSSNVTESTTMNDAHSTNYSTGHIGGDDLAGTGQGNRSDDQIHQNTTGNGAQVNETDDTNIQSETSASNNSTTVADEGGSITASNQIASPTNTSATKKQNITASNQTASPTNTSATENQNITASNQTASPTNTSATENQNITASNQTASPTNTSATENQNITAVIPTNNTSFHSSIVGDNNTAANISGNSTNIDSNLTNTTDGSQNGTGDISTRNNTSPLTDELWDQVVRWFDFVLDRFGERLENLAGRNPWEYASRRFGPQWLLGRNGKPFRGGNFPGRWGGKENKEKKERKERKEKKEKKERKEKNKGRWGNRRFRAE